MRTTMRWLGVVLALGPAMAISLAAARPGEDWPYDRLFKEADLVVVAEAAEVTATDDPAPLDWRPDLLEGWATTFAVAHTLKGKAPSGELKVVHFRLKAGVRVPNGPMLIAFRTKPTEVTVNDRKVQVGKGTYLLFLKARKDGRYEPASGQYDSALSVRELNSPLASLAGE